MNNLDLADVCLFVPNYMYRISQLVCIIQLTTNVQLNFTVYPFLHYIGIYLPAKTYIN